VPGEHNRQNAALAYVALQALSLTDEEILDGLATFPGVPGRLEYLGTYDGIKIYNDNNATTPQATIAGIAAVVEKGERFVLIAGGAYKNIDPSPLVEAIHAQDVHVVLLPGTGTDMLIEHLEKRGVGYVSVHGHTGQEVIQEALAKARTLSGEKGTILFSPGFASFGLFANEYERNDIFVCNVQDLMYKYEIE
jgi:UDP-N-acetylmuramoylalanine--D-glutamate ligase